MILVILLLFPSLCLSSSPIYFNQCQQDSDCFYMNGLCSIDGRCICSASNLFNQTNWRCYPPTASTSISFPSPTYYPLQANYIYLFQTTPGQLPSNWTCTVDGQYCQGQHGPLWWAMFNQSLTNVSWQCLQMAGLWPATVASLYPTNLTIPLTPDLELGCVDRMVYCGQRGSWNGSQCVCWDGWEGIRCQFPIASYHTIDPVIYPSIPCQNDSQCLKNQWCYWSQWQQSSVCYCQIGYSLVPSLADFGCIPVVTYLYRGAISAQNETLQFSLTWSPLTNFSWWTDDRGRLNQVYSPYPLQPGQTDLAMRVDLNRIWLIRNGTRNQTITPSLPTCLNGSTYSNLTRQCECPPAFAYSYNCSYLQWDCSADLCSAQGYCDQSQTGCACFENYYGDQCNLTALQCSQQRCNGTGQCLTQSQACQCQQWSTGFDCSLMDCVNGGIPILNGTQCECNANYSGPACQWLRCTQFGYWQDGRCHCWSPLHGLSQSGNCTVDLCMHGQLSPDGLSCNCQAGYQFNQTLYQCAPICQNGGWQIAPDRCNCPDGWTGSTCYAIDGLAAVEHFVKNDPWSIIYLSVSLILAICAPMAILLWMWRKDQTVLLNYGDGRTVESVMRDWKKELEERLLDGEVD